MRKLTVEIIVALLVLLWAYAAISKLLDYKTFAFQLGKSPYVTGIADFIAWALPVGELITVILLLNKKTRLIALYGSFFLMLLFTGYIYIMLHYSYYIPCSCGGILSKMSWQQHFIFNMAYTFIALTGILIYNRPTQKEINT